MAYLPTDQPSDEVAITVNLAISFNIAFLKFGIRTAGKRAEICASLELLIASVIMDATFLHGSGIVSRGVGADTAGKTTYISPNGSSGPPPHCMFLHPPQQIQHNTAKPWP